MADSPVIFEFGPYRLEPAQRRLTRDQAPVALTPKAFDLLVYLAEHPGQLLKKEQLLEHLWPGVFVEEVNLAQNISALRRALGGDSRESYVQTVAGTGYRFVASVTRAGQTSSASPVDATPRKRVIALPFRMLKADPDLDFLAFSLPDALTSELSTFNSLIVRSSLIAARFASEAPDLPRIATDAQVDFVVSGTILRAGPEIRVSAQLADAIAGTVLWSHTVQAPVGDLFRLQDSLVTKIVSSLARPLTGEQQRSGRQDVPANARAYELFLRANEVARRTTIMKPADAVIARDLYMESLEEDPNYAPTWARLARMYRLIGKANTDDAGTNFSRADDALQRALTLNPDLAIAHNWAAQIEVDRGSAPQAMVRLLDLVRRQGPNVEVFAGLVHACRFSGLLDASIAAHEQAARLDAAVDTGVMHAYFLQRRWQEAIVASGLRKGYVWGLSMAEIGRGEEAAAVTAGAPGFFAAVHAYLIGDHATARRVLRDVPVADPEAFFYVARLWARLADDESALKMLAKSIDGGYACVESLANDPWLDSIRGTAIFRQVEEVARQKYDTACRLFEQAGGAMLLGMR